LRRPERYYPLSACRTTFIGYLNAFWMYTVVSAIAIPLVLMVRRPKA
jgi:hypothetical protein